ncbi:MAG: polysaccharide export protein [Thermodesulfobacteriota bacterium]|jgi:polysaccharide export outer membrane protein|nr:MAG: polysaccharide export protein [Thermodesulfobacteriota bacterium]
MIPKQNIKPLPYFFLTLFLLLLSACFYPTIPKIDGEPEKAAEQTSTSASHEEGIKDIFQKKAPVFASPPQKEKEYEIGPEDVLEIQVWDHDDLTREIYVSREGVFSYPLIGTVRAGGLSIEQLEQEITNRLSGKYIIDPQVSVTVKGYKSKRVFVLGEVGGSEKGPGTYPLTGKTTLIEVLTLAGGLSKDAGSEVIVIRPKNIKENPVTLEQAGKEDRVIRINLRKLLEGDNSQNIYLEPNDTVFVSKAAYFFVYGEVKTPGRYNLEKGTTVLKAITTAGGATEKAAVNRTKVVREKEGRKTEINITMTDPIEPEDIVMVPESFF